MEKMLILLLFCSLLATVFGTCPSPLSLVAGGQCRGLYNWNGAYYYDATLANEAISQCNYIANAHPVSIHNDEQQSYWKSQNGKYIFVLGLLCNTTSTQWYWADGSSVDYKPPTGSYDAELDQTCKTACTWILQKDGTWHIDCTHTGVTIDFYCISELPRPPPASTDCGSFSDDDDDTYCFHIGKQAESWKDAQAICHSFGAEVASVHNVQENNYIRRLAVANGAKNGVLLGGTISGKGNDFGWVDGSDWDYTNFYPSFPIDGLGDCLTMDTVTTAGQWMNTDCATPVPVACSRPHYDTPELNGCSGGPWKEGQIIYSPGFPNDASVPCDYFLTVDAGKRVKLEILLLEANSCCDYLILTDGYVAGPIIANLTGEQSGKFYNTGTSSQSNTMRVSWQPNGGVNVRGVMMSFSTY